MDFKFSVPVPIPTLSDTANIALAFGYLVSRLASEERTRTVHPDGRNENVAEHSLMLVKVATVIAELYYPQLDSGRVAIFASLHDDVEAYVGDTPTDSIARHDATEKKQREERALEQISHEFASISSRYVQHVQAYEKQEETEARFVRVVDKIMVELIHFPNKGVVLRGHILLNRHARRMRSPGYG